MKKKLMRLIIIFALIMCIYPACVLGFTWYHVLTSDFKGGRNGQLDAYRHTLASATVSYTLGEWAVNLTTWIFESKGRESNKMDIHNNRIGANIGSDAKSFCDIEPAVYHAVEKGKVFAVNPNQVTWLPPSKWHDRKLW